MSIKRRNFHILIDGVEEVIPREVVFGHLKADGVFKLRVDEYLDLINREAACEILVADASCYQIGQRCVAAAIVRPGCAKRGVEPVLTLDGAAIVEITGITRLTLDKNDPRRELIRVKYPSLNEGDELSCVSVKPVVFPIREKDLPFLCERQ